MRIVCKQFWELTLDEIYEILRVRNQVFVVEQNCPYQDLDGKDQQSLHLYMEEGGHIVCYLRILPKGLAFEGPGIGRVLSLKRKKGLAKRLLQEAMGIIWEDWGEELIYLEAQSYIKSLYESLGFEIASTEFLEDGIPHIRMMARKRSSDSDKSLIQ